MINNDLLLLKDNIILTSEVSPKGEKKNKFSFTTLLCSPLLSMLICNIMFLPSASFSC